MLAAAAALVRHDLMATGCWDDRTAAMVDERQAHRRWWLAQWPAGAEHVPGLLAQDVQEAVHESGHEPGRESGREPGHEPGQESGQESGHESADRDWPLCPEHRDHALFVEPDLGPDPFWVCHRTGLPVAGVGGL